MPEYVHKGEFVLVVEGCKEQNAQLVQLPLEEHIKFYTDSGMDKKQAIKKTAKDRGVSKSEIYARLLGGNRN